jgi:hypothetical protein
LTYCLELPERPDAVEPEVVDKENSTDKLNSNASPASASLKGMSPAPQMSPASQSVKLESPVPQSMKLESSNSPAPLTLKRESSTSSLAPKRESSTSSLTSSPRIPRVTTSSQAMEKMCLTLKTALDAVKSNNIPTRTYDLSYRETPKVFITKWIDYCNKYGLGYQLWDGSVGVYFNDSTSVILSADDMYVNIVSNK